MGIGADHKTPTKSGELHGGTSEGSPKYPLAAAEQLSRRGGPLTFVALWRR